MADYKNGKIYYIECSETKDIYIGSTCKTLTQRLSQHNSIHNMCETRNFINPEIYLLEDYPCETKQELLWRERYWIQNSNCVNKHLPITTDEEKKIQLKKCNEEYYEENSESIKEYQKEYRKKNKEKIKKQKTEKITCDCGSIINRRNIARHHKTKKHLNVMSSKK